MPYPSCGGCISIPEFDLFLFTSKNEATGGVLLESYACKVPVVATNAGGIPNNEVAKAIDTDLGGFEKFKADFSQAGATRFGSGWAWLCIKTDGKLCVCSTPNQDNPLMDISDCKGTPILAMDVWEHAYYLNYQNRRPDYMNAFFNVINWNKVNELYLIAKH